jgi:hypothetical protein
MDLFLAWLIAYFGGSFCLSVWLYATLPGYAQYFDNCMEGMATVIAIAITLPAVLLGHIPCDSRVRMVVYVAE